MRQTSVVFDGMFLLHSEFGVYGSRSKGELRDDRDEAAFVHGVVGRFCNTLTRLPQNGQVVFCLDSVSWRKSVQIPPSPENPDALGYKEKREIDKGKTMDPETRRRFFSAAEETSKLLSAKGIIASKVPGAEGDDLVEAWTKRLMSMGHNVVVISGDGDLAQVAAWGQDGNWSVVWCNKANINRIVVPRGWQRSLRPDVQAVSNDIFSMDIVGTSQSMSRLIAEEQVEVVEVMPSEVAFKKVLMGDDGDGVPSAWSVNAKTKSGADKVNRVTPKVYEKIVEGLQAKGLYDREDPMSALGDGRDYLCGLILRALGDVDGTPERERVSERLDLNKRLVSLQTDEQPERLRDEMSVHMTEQLAQAAPDRSSWTKKALLEGTPYENALDKKIDPLSFMDMPF